VLARRTPRAAAALTAWSLVYLGFYAAYYNTHETWWYLRFILPAAPALVVGGFLGLKEMGGWTWERGGRGAFAIALAFILANGAWLNTRLETLKVGHGEANYPLAAAWLRAHLPADSVLAAMQVSGAIFYYADFTFFRWDQMDAGAFQRCIGAARAERRAIYAVLYSFEAGEALRERMRGRWTPVGSVRDITIWRYE